MKKIFNVGDVNKQTVSDIWTGDRMQHARETHRSCGFKALDLCRNCANSYNPKGVL